MGRLSRRSVLIGASLLCAAGLAVADRRDHDDARALREQGAIVPLEEILRTATAQHPGRVVEVELDRMGGAYVYEIELLDAAGEVWELRYDARTGALLKEELER
jgi:uncharacterized membrane protein YkoI